MPPHRYYYLHNFQQALAWIAQRYDDLLDQEERHFLTTFAGLPMLSQALMVRMLMRRGPWFRASRLVYEEIPDALAAAAPLIEHGMLDAHAPMTVDELFDLHTRPELMQRLSGQAFPVTARKQDMLLAAQLRWPAPLPHSQWLALTVEPVWRVTAGALCERFRLMFFGNLHQDWSEFVLADLGVFQYEPVPIDRQTRVFQARADVDTYLALHACRQSLDEGADVDLLVQQVVACSSENPWLEKRRGKVLLRIGQACERSSDWERALRVYEQCRYPGARHRRIRVYERLDRHDAAMALAQQALQTPETEEESQKVARMLPRLRRALGQGGTPRQKPLSIPRTDLCLPPPPAPLSVEWAVREHWHADAAPAYYVENALINSLFGLLCWEAVFAPVPGAFFHPFQRGPADLDSPDFAARREALFAACLARLDDGSYRQSILQRRAEKQGVQSPFVFWGSLTDELLDMALACIPAAHLRLLFTRLLADPRTNRAGLPDLIRFWPAEQRYEMVEVKGPGDKLQDNQIRWMQYCLAHGVPVRVCHVCWDVGAEAQAEQDAALGLDTGVLP